MLSAKIRARIALGHALRPIPIGWTERLRTLRATSAPGTMRYSISHRMAGVLRHRPLAPLETFTLPDNSEVRLVALESLLARLLYWYGETGYEGSETFWWRRFCREAHSILELGANIGYYSVQGGLANPAARYRAVEANPAAAEVVKRNLALNNVTNVEVLAVAVVGAKTSETLELAFPDQEQYAAPTGAYLSDRAEGVDERTFSRSVTVDVAAMTDLLQDADLLKLDIEGVEAEVLTSVMSTLLESRPVIFLEVLSGAGRLRPVLSKLHHGGYVVYAIGEQSLHLLTREQIDAAEPLPRYGSRDVILVPASRIARL
jgi:FkbM family methyltransferase